MSEYNDILATVNVVLISINGLFLVIIGVFVRDVWNRFNVALMDIEQLKRKSH